MTAPKLAVTPCMGVWIETTKACDGSLQSASHPVWVCGLKQVVRSGKAKEQTVTPCMGVWIETGFHPYLPLHYLVTPCMGVWIETLCPVSICKAWGVTPCMGVWIETYCR